MLTILSVGFPLAPVRFDTPGGAEQVLLALDKAIVQADHRSLVIAPAGSAVAGELVATPALPPILDKPAVAGARIATDAAIRAVLAREPVDLVHMHGLDFASYLPPPGPPVLVTLHLPLDWYSPASLRPERPLTFLHGVSMHQHRGAAPHLGFLAPIPNGVDVGAFAGSWRPKQYLAALARICPEKGLHLALDAARAAGRPLLIGGRAFGYAAHLDYLEREIRPRLNRERRVMGSLGPRGKRRLLGGAAGLLAPSLAPETSSLVAMEALAAGTPVVAFPMGALAEIVEHERTGFLVRDMASMAAAIAELPHISRADCRKAAMERFSLARCTAAYLARYRELAGAGRRRAA